MPADHSRTNCSSRGNRRNLLPERSLLRIADLVGAARRRIAADVSNTTWIGNIFGVTTVSSTTAPVVVSDNGQLGTVASSQRFKKDIESMDTASEAILSLRPVTFHYKNDDKCTAQFG